MHFSAHARLNRTLLVTATAAVLAVALTGPLAPETARLGSVAALVLLLLGALRLAGLQSRRAARFARFVSPGIAAALEGDDLPADSSRELSVVYADVRNFTAFAEATDPAAVLRFLREYYEAIGNAVAAHGGTVKDYAGDGVMVLVGATEALADHADRAIALACAIRAAASDVTVRWSSEGSPLGVGVGVASGMTALGMVGGTTERMEFAAVGPAVNLAARLCGRAAADEVLVDAHTLSLARQATNRCIAGQPMALKGIDRTVVGYALTHSA
ncbi:MAG: adenylate/guanylate cyclase domain-containing protein [Pseudomonadota bacterium]